MKIWIISDTHTRHEELTVPEVDMVIHCGDSTCSRQAKDNLREQVPFLQWLEGLNIEHKVMIGGNHDTSLALGLVDPTNYGINYLQNRLGNVGGIDIYGSPLTPTYGNWEFMYPRHKNPWTNVPECDIMVTHGPGMGVLDLTRDRNGEFQMCGCKQLLKAIERVQPKYHCFGHIHNERGIINYGILDRGIKYINAACINHHSQEIMPGHIINV
jgi:Icc-related predicted phosphoesterase